MSRIGVLCYRKVFNYLVIVLIFQVQDRSSSSGIYCRSAAVMISLSNVLTRRPEKDKSCFPVVHLEGLSQAVIKLARLETLNQAPSTVLRNVDT